MKNLLIVIAALISTSAFALPFNAKSMSGDKVHFQAASTWVNSYYSKSLCFDGENFEATVQKCVKWESSDDNRVCVKTKTYTAVQAQESTRQRCAARNGGEDDRCTSWDTVRYFQNDVKTIKFFSDEDRQDLVKTVTIQVPSCK
jgi:hypothetical protein